MDRSEHRLCSFLVSFEIATAKTMTTTNEEEECLKKHWLAHAPQVEIAKRATWILTSRQHYRFLFHCPGEITLSIDPSSRLRMSDRPVVCARLNASVKCATVWLCCSRVCHSRFICEFAHHRSMQRTVNCSRVGTTNQEMSEVFPRCAPSSSSSTGRFLSTFARLPVYALRTLNAFPFTIK